MLAKNKNFIAFIITFILIIFIWNLSIPIITYHFPTNKTTLTLNNYYNHEVQLLSIKNKIADLQIGDENNIQVIQGQIINFPQTGLFNQTQDITGTLWILNITNKNITLVNSLQTSKSKIFANLSMLTLICITFIIIIYLKIFKPTYNKLIKNQ